MVYDISYNVVMQCINLKSIFSNVHCNSDTVYSIVMKWLLHMLWYKKLYFITFLHVGDKLNCARLLNQTPTDNDTTTVSEQTAVT